MRSSHDYDYLIDRVTLTYNLLGISRPEIDKEESDY